MSFGSFGTDAIHAGQKAEKWKSKSVIPPINLATTFKLDDTSFDLDKHFYYGRIGNPTRECLEQSVAKLENAKHALAFSSGMGAITTVMESCLKVFPRILVAHPDLVSLGPGSPMGPNWGQ